MQPICYSRGKRKRKTVTAEICFFWVEKGHVTVVTIYRAKHLNSKTANLKFKFNLMKVAVYSKSICQQGVDLSCESEV